MRQVDNYRLNENTISNMDLNLFYCGEQDCSPNHFWGPSVRDHFLIHYVVSGKGIFEYQGKKYTLGKGQGFLISPYKLSFYQADSKDPWTYKWIGFNGINAQVYLERANLNVEQPIFTYDRDEQLENCITGMIDAQKFPKSRDLVYKSLLYSFLACLIESSPEDKIAAKNHNISDLYVKKAVEFINMNYSRKMSVEEMTKFLGLSRKYFSKIFKGITNTTPKEYLMNYRVNKACELMSEHSLSISNIARSVGYDDPLLFSKIFKKIKGLSPREYEKKIAAQGIEHEHYK